MRITPHIDPSGIEMRLRRCLHRRQYSVASPNSLWHIDGYHKLIRWRLVIDCYSRIPVYLKVASNNEAELSLMHSVRQLQSLFLPSRVRADRGGENILIARYTTEHSERGRGSFIVGQSVHNQRIERLWRNVFFWMYNIFLLLVLFTERCWSVRSQQYI